MAFIVVGFTIGGVTAASGAAVAGAFAGAAIGASVGGLALTAYGQHEAGQAAKATGKYNAKLAENEAIAKEQQAHIESMQMQKQKERLQAAQRAGFAKSGAVITKGTPLLLMAEQAGIAELDILNQQRNRALEATALRSEASLSKFQGKQAAKAANIQAGTTLLGGLSGAASMIPKK